MPYHTQERDILFYGIWGQGYLIVQDSPMSCPWNLEDSKCRALDTTHNIFKSTAILELLWLWLLSWDSSSSFFFFFPVHALVAVVWLLELWNIYHGLSKCTVIIGSHFGYRLWLLLGIGESPWRDLSRVRIKALAYLNRLISSVFFDYRCRVLKWKLWLKLCMRGVDLFSRVFFWLSDAVFHEVVRCQFWKCNVPDWDRKGCGREPPFSLENGLFIFYKLPWSTPFPTLG